MSKWWQMIDHNETLHLIELAQNGFMVFSCDINTNVEEVENIVQIK